MNTSNVNDIVELPMRSQAVSKMDLPGAAPWIKVKAFPPVCRPTEINPLVFEAAAVVSCGNGSEFGWIIFMVFQRIEKYEEKWFG